MVHPSTHNVFCRNKKLASSGELSQFLESVERRAFKQAIFAVREEESALDIVQDSMLKLAEKYGDRPAQEFPMLFQRILQNTIRDFYRRSKVRSMWTTLLSAFTPDDDEDYDPLETLAADEDAGGTRTPESLLLQAQTLNLIDDEIKKLPARQREAFIMRYWEDMDVAETAAAMGCSEGSVKTHCSRATHTLASALSARGIKL
ncbi:MAG: RNA polymerase sigma factor [Rhodocyclaceae bacterium]|nr:RNA polymerase sigma factor [Rhodocyclaceae bacterium]